jgi:uncharacterized repeat protein (TIGR03803 family)
MKSSKSSLTLAVVFACAAITFSLAVGAQAQTVTYLGHFNGVNGNGPSGPVVQASDGNFYGTTEHGGVNAQGNVFRMTPSGKITSIYSFCSKPNCADGQFPITGPVLGTDGNLYGVTSEGGDSTNSGTIYKMTLSGKITTIYTFNCGLPCNNGSEPTGITLGSDGNLYGTTTLGGGNSNGALFKISPAGKITLLHTFCSSSNCADGGIPLFPPHQGTDGNFYGGTNAGGTAVEQGGVLYKLTLAGVYSVVKSFCQPSASCNTGFYPTMVVQDANRNLFGTTANNGSFNSGTIFEITSTNKFKVLHTFSFNGGQAPTKGLTLAADGNYYGVGINDDDFDTTAGFGTIFKVTPSGVYSTVHTFENNPSGPLYQAADGNLYGVTDGDGSTDFGSVYRLSIGGK